MKRKSQYTDEMIDFLVTNLEKYSWVELTKRFNLNFNCNKGEYAIRKFCSRNEKYFKNKRRKKILLTEFTKEMEDFLRANFKDISQEELTRRFNNKFNLKKEVYDIRYYCLKVTVPFSASYFRVRLWHTCSQHRGGVDAHRT